MKIESVIMKNKNIIIWLDFGIPVLLLIISTFLFNKFNWDILIQKLFFTSDNGWFLKNDQPWKFLYNYGNIPALLLSVSSLVLLSISFFKLSLSKYRKILIFLTIVMALGPGLLINSILKDNWGRPRPRDIIEFEGNYNYEKVLEIDPSSRGKSFPCGHASMGFYLMTLFFIFRRNKKLIAYVFLLIGISYGGLIGLARIVQGGHFASDVIWAGGLVYLVAAGSYYLLKMNRNLLIESTSSKLPIKRNFIILILTAATIALALLIIMADSYHYSRTYSFDVSFNEISIKIERGDVELTSGDSLLININAIAHGFPWSKLKTKVYEKENSIFLKQRESGYFTEVNQTLTIFIPDSLDLDISIRIDEGNLILTDISREFLNNIDLRKGSVIK
ncbi:phosphatase PAP2 family protein [Candidatus Cloacimonadota bacterium]